MPITTPTTSISFPTIPAMQLRRGLGRILDRVFYRNESVVIERAGEPLAAVVPLVEYQQLRQLRKKAKARLFTKIDRLRETLADKKPEEVEELITEAIQATRNA